MEIVPYEGDELPSDIEWVDASQPPRQPVLALPPPEDKKEDQSVESGLSEMSTDEETEAHTGSRRYFPLDNIDALELMGVRDLVANNFQEFDAQIARIFDPLDFDPNRIPGYLRADQVRRILDIMQDQFPAIDYPARYHYRHSKTLKILSRFHKTEKHFAVRPWFYVTRQPRFLGVQEVEDHIILPLERGDVQDREQFKVFYNVRRSRPNHFIYQSQMKIPYCGEKALLRAFTNLYTIFIVVIRLFQSVFARHLDLREIVGRGRITLWFQITIEKPADLDPKELNRVVFTTDLFSIPIATDDDLPFVISAASLFLGSYILWRIDMVSEDSDYYDLISEDASVGHVSDISMYILKPPEAGGGCRNYFGNRYLTYRLVRYGYDPPSRFNNCLFFCIYKALDLVLSDAHAEEDRQALCIPSATKITLRDMLSIAEYFCIYIKIYRVQKLPNGQKRITFWQRFGPKESANHVNLLMKCSHFCLMMDVVKLKQFRQCASCSKWINNTTNRGRKHLELCRRCTVCSKSIVDEHDCEKRDRPEKHQCVRSTTTRFPQQFVGIKNVYSADFETFQPKDYGEQIVYAAGLMLVSEIKEKAAKAEMRLFYGSEALDRFCHQILNLPGKATIVMYNGSRFDFWFILRWMLKHNIKITEMLREKKSNKIMKLCFGQVTLWDLCLFTMASLKQLCVDYNLPKNYQKKEFNHHLIKSWEDVTTHKREVEKYLYFDVLCLGLCHINFVEKTWNLYQWSAIKCTTLSHLAYDVWRNKFIERENVQKVKLSTAFEYQWLRRGLFGGRVMAYRKGFKSIQYFSYDDLLTFDAANQTAIYNNVTDYLVYLDVVSLYPFVCKQPFCIGTPVWKDDELHIILEIFKKALIHWTPFDYDLVCRSYVEVDVKCPSWIAIPFLFARLDDGTLIQDLRNKIKQVYDGETIIESLILGYRIIKVHRWLLYPKRENILDQYMTFSFENKAKHQKTEAEYHVYKGMMNNFTGKCSQQPIDTEQHIFHDDVFLQQFMDKDKVDDIRKVECMKDNNDDHLGFYVEMDKEAEITKPLHIGVSLLAKSRVLMSQYTRAMNGYGSASDVEMKNCPYYGDTDSLITHVDTYKNHQHTGIFGSEWGQLKDEFGGKSKIVAAYFPSPKTYALEYWTLRPDGTIKVSWYIRAKGIPKGREGSTETICPGAEEFAKLEQYIQAIPLKPRDLKEFLFSLYDRDGKRIYTTTSLPFYYFEEMMCNDCFVVVHFGKMRRFLVDPKGRGASVQLNLDLHRTINKERWWKDDGTGKRTVLTDHIWGPSVPRGHMALT